MDKHTLDQAKFLGNSVFLEDYFYNKIKKITLFLILVVAMSVYIFDEAVRLIFVPENISYLNPLYCASAAIVSVIFIFNRRFNYLNLYLAVLFFGMTMINSYFLGKNTTYMLLVFQAFCMPLFFTCIKLGHGDIKYVLDKFLNIFNVCIILVIILGVIDYITNSSIQLFLADRLFNGELSDLIYREHGMGIYRYYSILGHPLTTVKFFLVYLVLNLIYNRYFESKINVYILSFTASVGFVLSGSKSALILGGILVFTSGFFIRKNKALYFTLIAIVSILLTSTPLFQENILQRFYQGIESGDLSTGRNELIYRLLEDSSEKPNLVLGKGSGYSRVVAKSLGGGALNFEYPIIMLPYDFSILGTLIIYIIIFIIPVTKFIRNKSYFLLYIFIILFLYENGNNGISSVSDSLGRFIFVIFTLTNLSEYLKTERQLAENGRKPIDNQLRRNVLKY
ncbi:MAG: hypothetical protein GX660_04515 [Clostridiaceae bacterium]|nr:hypothetical protein [Clostridiaceae bacterium]